MQRVGGREQDGGRNRQRIRRCQKETAKVGYRDTDRLTQRKIERSVDRDRTYRHIQSQRQTLIVTETETQRERELER